MRRLVLAFLLLSVTAFAGRPVYLCLMEQKVAAAKPACHMPKPGCHHCDQGAAPAAPLKATCMINAGSSLAPAVEPFVGPAVVPVVVAELTVPRDLALAALAGGAPALRFESPPNSIDILRI